MTFIISHLQVNVNRVCIKSDNLSVFVRFSPNFNRTNHKNCKTGLLRQGVPHGTGNLCGGQFNARIRRMDEIIVADQGAAYQVQ